MNKYVKKTFENTYLGEKYERYTHPSGLNIYVYPKDMTTTYAIFGIKYGSIDNSFITHDGKTVTVPDGIAHFLEHKLFFNEDGSDSFERFASLGADANAFTSNTKTAYLFSCSDNFDRSLAELITFVTHPYFTKESVESEVGIITEEIQMCEDNPINRCYYGCMEALYHTHSIKKKVAGTVDSIREITPELLYDCYRSFYRPSNMVLAVCGNVTAKQVLAVVDSCLPDDFCGDAVGKVNENLCEPPTPMKEYVVTEMDVLKPLYCIGIKDTDIPDDPVLRIRKSAVMSVIIEALFSMSVEFRNDMLDRCIAPMIYPDYTISDSYACLTIEGQANDPLLFLEELRAYIERTLKDGISEESFLRAKNVLLACNIKNYDSTECIGDDILDAFCDGVELFDYDDILKTVTFEEVQSLFHKFFKDAAMTLSVVKKSSEN